MSIRKQRSSRGYCLHIPRIAVYVLFMALLMVAFAYRGQGRQLRQVQQELAKEREHYAVFSARRREERQRDEKIIQDLEETLHFYKSASPMPLVCGVPRRVVKNGVPGFIPPSR